MKNNFRFIAIIVLLTIVLTSLESCGSACARQHRYWNTHRCVMIETKDTAQFAFANNQIVMFEKNAY